MKTIHLIQYDVDLRPKPITPGSLIFESGFWKLPVKRAKSLIGGDIYFHEKQISPSFLGGIIKDCRVQREGKWKSRIIFKFEASLSHEGIYPKNPQGWSRVMNFED